MVSAFTRATELKATPIEVIDKTRDILGESAVWDAQDQVLWWVDGIGCNIHCLNHSSGKKRSWNFNEEVGSIGLRAAGGLVVGMRSGLFTFDPGDGELTEICRPDADFPDHRFNDGKVDRSGRFWTGTIKAAEYEPRGRVFRLNPDRTTKMFLQGITCVNGLSFSPDNRLMYFSDSFSRKIEVFDYDDIDGEIYNRRFFAEVALGRGVCDGATVDADGCLWSANANGWCVTRYDPHGKVDMVFNLPVQKPTSLCFGGPDLSTLFITTGTRRLSDTEQAQQPLAGNLLAIRPGVKGIAEGRYAG